jgi:hydrogenase nickel incorporation protein HypA/HybF
MSIVLDLIKVVQRELEAHPGLAVHIVRLRIGKLRLVIPETLQFCYEIATRDTPLAGSQLEIETVPPAARCEGCATEFEVWENWFECPHCHSGDVRLLRGRELELVSFELEHAGELETTARS